MLVKLLTKIANMSKKAAVFYLLGIVIAYFTGMSLVIYGAIMVGNNLNNAYFWSGLAIWIPTCIVSILTALSSNYIKEIKKIKEKEEAKRQAHDK